MSKGFQVPLGKFYLVDGGYANTPSFLAPYRGVQYHLKEFGAGHRRPQNPKELFNHRHTLLRNHVERALGVLKKRFPILKVATFHMLENQVKIPIAAFIFHNLPPRNFIVVPSGNQMNDLNVGSVQGNTLRDTIAQEMWVQYQQHLN